STVKNDNTAALAAVDKALLKHPEDTRLKVLRNQLASPGKNPAEISDSAIAMLPPYEQELALADKARMQGEEDEASPHLQKAADLNQKDARALEVLFHIAMDRGQWDVANNYITRLSAPDVDGDKVGGQLYRWQLAMAKGDYSGAMDIAQKLTHDNGVFAQSWLSLAQTQHILGKYDEAIPNYLQA